MLVAIVVLLAVLVVANMLLTWGMLRRLRALQEQVAAVGTGPSAENGLHPGDPAPDFTALTPAGDTVTRDEVVRGETVLVFMSPHCEACETHLPTVRQLGRGADGPATIAVIDGTREESGHLLDGLQGEVPVLFAPHGVSDLFERYQVFTFPSSYVVGVDGRITGSHLDLDELLPSRT